MIDLTSTGSLNDCFIVTAIIPLLKHEGIMEGPLLSEVFRMTANSLLHKEPANLLYLECAWPVLSDS